MYCKAIEATEKKSVVTQLKGGHASYKVRNNPEMPLLSIFQNSQKTQSNKTRERNKGVQIRKKELQGGGPSVGKALTSIGLEFKCLLPM